MLLLQRQTDIQTALLIRKLMTSSSKILLLGAVLCMASCAKEVVPSADKARDNLLTISMPSGTKTALGTKDGGSYPVLWSKGDVLRVNGEASSEAKIIEDGTVANFTIPSSVSLPYSIVYPYSDEVSVRDGVIFPSAQEYAEGTFCEGAAPMYAYCSSFDNVGMHYLASVLRLQVKAASGNVKLNKVMLSCEKQIAGQYSVDCQSGTITPAADAQYNITYSLPEGGLSVGNEPASFFIALPSGDFGTIEATVLSNEGSAMILKLAADNLRAGIVREYPAVEFSAQADYFVIGNDAQMMEFAKAVAGGSFNKSKAILTCDIDMSDTPWTSIKDFSSTFDGMGHTIAGLCAPLFETLSGTVCNTTIHSAISETASLNIGAVACKLAGGTISRVNIEGLVEYIPAAVPAEANFGAVVGDVSSGTITGCVNNATLRASLPEDAKTAKIRMGGMAGRLLGTAGDKPLVSGCTNNGQILPDFQVCYELSSGGIAGRAELSTIENCTNTRDHDFKLGTDFCYAGGLVGVAKDSRVGNSTNYGKILLGGEAKVNSYFYGGGIAAYTHSSTTLESCMNEADVTMDNVNWNATRFLAGGIAGYGNEVATTFKDCVNNGKITVAGTVKGSAAYSCIGGIAGRTMASMSGCTNNGAIEVSLRASASETGVGGIIGTSYSTSVKDCTNNATLTYNVTPDPATALTKAFYLGGVVGSLSPTGTGNYEYTGLQNKADILLNGSPAVLAIKTGGAAGRNTETRDDMTDLNRIAIGGVAGRMLLTNAAAVIKMDDCSNSGNISAPEAGKIRYTAFGGVCGEVVAADATLSGCSNSGNITVDRAYNDGTNLHLGGVVGFIPIKKFTTCSITVDKAVNTGNISLSEINNTIQEARAGGILGDVVSSNGHFLTLTLSDCVNRGNISRVSSKRFASQSFGGGIAGSIGAGTWSYNATFSDFDARVVNCENYGTIQFDACTSSGKVLTDQTYNESATGGIVGNLRGTVYTTERVRPATVEGCRNYGKVTGYSGFLGGICGIVSYYGTITGDNVNEGEVGFRYSASGTRDLSSLSYSTDLTTCGGIVGELFQGKLPTAAAPGYTVVCENAVNKGDVGAVRAAGGVAGAFNEGGSTSNDILGCANSATIYGFYGNAGAITGSKMTEDPELGRVRGCRVGGTVVRGSASSALDADNFYNFIYQTAVSNDGLNTYWDGK